jgi:hypothetical protein
MVTQTDTTMRVGGFPVHPAYAARVSGWQILLHAYHGTGGFADGGYLVGHAREFIDWNQPTPSRPTAKLTLRRKLARWENICKALLDAKRQALFRKPPTRTIGNPAYQRLVEDFWSNVDGKETHLDDWLPHAWTPAALLGHAAVVFDWTEGETAAGAVPYLALYDATGVVDWAVDDRGRLLEVRLLEDPPRRSVKDPLPTRLLSRIVNATQSEIADGTLIRRIPHRLGRIPVALLAAQRLPQSPVIGASVVGDPRTFVDYYNLISENRELLRFVMFPILNIPIGTVPVETVQGWLGDATGVQHAMFTPEPAQLIEPDGKSVEAFMAERQALLRTMFRLANVQWESDSRDAESAEALRLKASAMNDSLSGYADELQKFEYELLELLFRFRYGAEQWEREYDAAQIAIVYPDRFDLQSFEDLLAQAQAAMTLELGPTFTAEQKKRLVRELLPDLDATLVEQITHELDAPPASDLPPVALRRRLSAA